MPRTSSHSSPDPGRRIFLLSLFAAALVGPGAALAQDVTAVRPTPAQVTAERLRALDRGEVEISSNKEPNGNRFVVYAVVKTTPERVFEIIQDFAGTTRWVPDQTEATVLERRGSQLRGRIKTHMPWPFSDRHVEMWVENYQATVGGVSSSSTAGRASTAAATSTTPTATGSSNRIRAMRAGRSSSTSSTRTSAWPCRAS